MSCRVWGIGCLEDIGCGTPLVDLHYTVQETHPRPGPTTTIVTAEYPHNVCAPRLWAKVCRSKNDAQRMYCIADHTFREGEGNFSNGGFSASQVDFRVATADAAVVNQINP